MSALSIQPTYPIFTETDGQPLEDGYIWIGQVNLDPQVNPINVYFDAALTIPAGQPIRTINGYPSRNGTPARLYVNSDYSIRVMNKNGSLVYSAPAATERYNDAVVNLTINAADVIYDPSGAGAQQTNVQEKLRLYVNAEDYGFSQSATGVANASALQAAFAASLNVKISQGSFDLSSTITIPASGSLIGAGKGATVINVTLDVTAFVLSAQSVLEGVYVTPTGAHTTNLIQVGDSSTNNAGRSRISDVIVEGAGAQGIIIVQGNLGTLENIKSFGNTLDGIHFQAVTVDANAWTLQGFIDLIDNGRDGLHITGGSSVSDPSASRQHQAFGVTCQQNGRYGVYVGSRSNIISAYCEVNTTADVYLDGFARGNEIKTTEGFVVDASGDPMSNLVYNFNANAAYWRIFQNKTQFSGVSDTGWRISNNDGNAGYFDFEKTATRQFSGIAGGSAAVQELIWDNENPSYELISRFGGRIDPLADNAYSVGEGAARWSVVYAATGTINTSDEREKQQWSTDIAPELKAWAKVEFGKFKFNDAIERKGEEKARWHFGVLAQKVKEAFESEGLDAFEYGLLCYDEWDDKYENVIDDDGKETGEKILVRPAGNRFGVRYEEALVLECALLRSKLTGV